MKKKAVFPGTFDPFTTGHHSLVKRFLALVDEIVIAIGRNDAKKSYFSPERRIEMIRSLYKDETRISVETYDCLTVDFAKAVNAGFIVRGIRSVNDFEYEKTIADINRNISGIETLILFTEPEFAYVSSSIVRELLRFGHDASEFVPEGICLDSRV
ncbi:MAG: pantetheine-phosphate adenylyltransferase [Prevotella sp.]|jgi:pantetheine-phosphate adenylyltransferase|nr:pantetheine-phosphate adenylyltransferase [Prevotella sp.]